MEATLEEYEQSENCGKLFGAMAAAQAVLGRADKDGKNPHYRSRYATLTSVIEAVRPVLAEYKLCIMQHPHGSAPSKDGMVRLTTVIGHESGQWVRAVSSVTIGKKADSHAFGSCVSYLRRYSLASVTCLVQDDDDGNQVSHVQRRRAAPQPATPAASPPMPAAEFNVRLKDVEVTLPELLGWCEAHNKGDPRTYARGRQLQMLAWLEKGGDKSVQQWAIDNALAGGGEG